jgi:hypothetical protein
MHIRTGTLIAFAVAMLASLTSHAQTFSYRNVDLAFFPEAELDADDTDVDGDGVQLRGSLPLYENFFVFTEFQDLNFDEDIDTTRLLIGGGGHWPIANNIDFVARLGIVHYEVDAGSADDDDTGVLLGARIRALVAPKFEVEAGVEHQRTEVFDIENDTYFIGEARYNFTPQWAAGAILQLGSDTSLLGIQGRFNF